MEPFAGAVRKSSGLNIESGELAMGRSRECLTQPRRAAGFVKLFMPTLQEQFGQIDIYLFDQLLKGRISPGMRILDSGCGAEIGRAHV